ncbi:corvet complex core vacuolar protein (macronuclear) [Tetrahymena thermophila SB210]|uniref:Corvet complex core vacuolar protein n=1 Tax=Tetrahymena thermophila (strain SB210) TaxID=312017 RepID=Q233D4_TETTS|nr:corvet complex core vacuolar protein [Tetrahymena thermophila SB210]EAR91646.1 corvet complex core vacuolar protein [Tetrahymena thermophila SB210]|eukprot:XP_001011891.1 corvet complex core vacuolar protein [Tetrahymena thermophila SB210]
MDKQIRKNSNETQLYKNDDKLIKQGRKYSDSLTQNYIDPLKELDKEIRDSFFFRQGVKHTDFFRLSQLDTTIDEKTQVNQIDIIHHEFTHEIIIENMEDYGAPTAICESKNYLIIGTSRSIFYIFDKREKENVFFGGIDKQNESGKVCSLAINHDELIFAAGFENGDIGIYELKSNYPRMTTIKKVFKSPIKIIQFISEYQNSLKEFCMIVFDTTGQNQKIQVDVTIVFEKRFTSVTKDKYTYQLMTQINDEMIDNHRSNSATDEHQHIRERSISDKYKETFKTQDGQSQKTEIINYLPIEEISYFDSIQSSQFFKKHFKILAMTTNDSIYVGFIMYKSIQITFQFQKSKMSSKEEEEEENKPSKPSISWGQGYFYGNNSGQPILCIGWEDHVFLIKAQLLDDEYVHFYQTAYAKFSYQVEKCVFISNSIIFIIFTNKECAIIHTSNFTLGPLDTSISKLNSCMYLDHIPEFQKLSLFCSQSKHTLFYHFGDCSAKFLLPQSLMFSFNLKKWQAYFNDRNSLDWIKLMQHGLMVQNNIIKYLGGVEDEKKKRQDEMKTFFQTLGLTYIQLSLVTDQELSQETINQILTLGTEFLLSTDNSEYLFSVVSIGIKNFGYEENFLECLQTFIEHSKLRHVPNDYLKVVMNFYSSKGRYDVLQKLILNLDLTNLDISPLLVMCMEYDLYNALIYICAKSGDFLTPLVKLFGRHQRGFEKKEQERKFGLKVLWYIQQSFSGIMIDGSKIEDKIYPQMLRNLILFVFQIENLQNLLQIDRKITLDIVFILFKQRVQGIIMKNYDIFRIEVEEENIKKYNIFQQDKITPQFVPYQRILTILLKNKDAEIDLVQKSNKSQEDKKLEIQVLEHLNNVFFSRVLELQSYPFNLDKQIEIVNFLIDNPKIFNYFEQKMLGLDAEVLSQEERIKQNILLEQGLFLTDTQKYHKKCLVRNAFLINVLRPLVPEIKNPLVMSNLIQQTELSEFTEACCFLYNFQKNYKKCFDLYYECRNPLIQTRIFEWIEQVFENQQPGVQDLKNIVIKKIKELVKLDQYKAKILIKKYFSDQQRDIILQLDQYPDDQLAILEEFVNEQDKTVTDEIKNMYIKLLCQRKPQMVIQALKEREQYPIDQALQYCKEYKVLDAQVYLNQRNGNFTDALNIQLQIIQQCWKEYVKNYSPDQINFNQNLVKNIQLNLKKGMEICYQAQKEDDSNDSLWFTMFDEVVVQEIGIQTLTSPSDLNLQSVSTQIVSELLEAMAININLNDVLDRINSNYQDIPLKAFLQTNEHFKQSFEFLTSAHTTAKQILQDHMIKIQENYLKIKNRGLSGSQLPDYRVCQFCENQIKANQQEFQNTETIVFYCGHTFHKKCVDEFIQPIACPICIENPIIYLTNYLSKNITKNLPNRLNQKEEENDSFLDEASSQAAAANGWNTTTTYSAPIAQEKPIIKQTKNKMLEKLQKFDKNKKQKVKETQDYIYSQQ